MNEDASEADQRLAEPSGPGTNTTRIAHLSDVHFGRIGDPAIVGALVREVNGAGVDLVVVSGDLTQRARKDQFRAARAMLEAFGPPLVVVPGNHDVPAWWHDPARRVLRPNRKYSQLIGRHFVAQQVVVPEGRPAIRAFGLDSAHGLTIKGGRIRKRELVAMGGFFGSGAPADFRVAVVHHHLTRLVALGKHDVARGATRALGAMAQAQVDLVLCGHLHASHVAHVETAQPGGHHRLVIASAGTATSNRSREADGHDVNFYNWIDVEPARFTIRERRYEAPRGQFVSERDTSFTRETR